MEENRKNDTYAKALSALVTTRAILMQITPYLTLFSMGAISISSCPMLIWRDDTNRSTGQRNQVWRSKTAEDRVPWQSNLFPLLVLNPLERAFAAEEEEKFKRRKWILRLRAIIIFITCSRFFTFALNIFKFGLSIYILYQPNLGNLILATFFAFLPYALCAGLSILITVGKKLNIRDPGKLLAPRKEERDITHILEEFSKLGTTHISFEAGFFVFSNHTVLEHIYATLLKERNRSELKKYRLENADKAPLRGDRTDRKKVHILEFILGDEFQTKRTEARDDLEDWVMLDLEKTMGNQKRGSQRSQSAGGGGADSSVKSASTSPFSWGGRRRQQGLDISELGAQTAAADARARATHIMEVQLEKETVRRLMSIYLEEDRQAGRVAGATLWSRYLDKILVDEMARLQKEEEEEEGDGFPVSAEARLASAKSCCETRVNRKLLREGLKGVWFKWLPEGPRFVYHDVNKIIGDVVPIYTADGQHKSDEEIMLLIKQAADEYQWLENVWWERGNFHWREKGLGSRSPAGNGRSTMTNAQLLGIQESYEPQPVLQESKAKNVELRAKVEAFLDSNIAEVFPSIANKKDESRDVFDLRCQIYAATNERCG